MDLQMREEWARWKNWCSGTLDDGEFQFWRHSTASQSAAIYLARLELVAYRAIVNFILLLLG